MPSGLLPGSRPAPPPREGGGLTCTAYSALTSAGPPQERCPAPLQLHLPPAPRGAGSPALRTPPSRCAAATPQRQARRPPAPPRAAAAGRAARSRTRPRPRGAGAGGRAAGGAAAAVAPGAAWRRPSAAGGCSDRRACLGAPPPLPRAAARRCSGCGPGGRGCSWAPPPARRRATPRWPPGARAIGSWHSTCPPAARCVRRAPLRQLAALSNGVDRPRRAHLRGAAPGPKQRAR